MPRFIKLSRHHDGKEIWINPDWIIHMEGSDYDDAGTFFLLVGGQYVENYQVKETIDQIMEMLNGE